MTSPREAEALPLSSELHASPMDRSISLPPGAIPAPDLSPSTRGRMEQAVARFLFSRSPRTLLRMSGQPQVERHGRKLDPQIQFLLAMRRRQGQVDLLRGETPEKARKNVRESALRYSLPDPAMDKVSEFHIPGPGGSLRVRHYVPAERGPLPLIVFFHGGGFVVCDLDTHDQPCRMIAKHARAQVLSVDYRLAPEHPFPAALDDARAAFAWAVEHAAMLGADPSRIGVSGDSAGGNLAAGVALATAREGRPAPSAQFLIYPVTDIDTSRPSRMELCHHFGLTIRDMEWAQENYTGLDPVLEDEVQVAPLRAPDLSGLAPAVVLTAGFDPLRDEGNAYADALRAAGNRVSHLELEGLVHGFIHMVAISSAAREGMLAGCGQLHNLLWQ